MPRALLSVYDKTGLIDFARGLVKLNWELIASGGTAKMLEAANLPVTPVEQITGAPEMLDGRVKTLHPAIHAAILARDTDADRAELAAQGYAPIDMVVCNLYPFEETVSKSSATMEEAIEQIDIGGVTLIRAAAKNHARVTVICAPEDYQHVFAMLSAEGRVDNRMRESLAVKAFLTTHTYDNAIYAYLSRNMTSIYYSGTALPAQLSLELNRIEPLRYGENPHQAGAFYPHPAAEGQFLGGELLGGNKQLSYNNLLDLDSAWRAVELFDDPSVVIVKHLNPCGIASAGSLDMAFRQALASDPVSAYGGVIAVNRVVTEPLVDALGDLFIEAIAAPEFTPGAQHDLMRKRKNCRLLHVKPEKQPFSFEFRSLRGGVLAQSIDRGDPANVEWQVVTKRAPNDAESAALRFAWKATQAVKSNAIVIGVGRSTVGIGGGLSSRLDAARLAVLKAGDRARGGVMASDAFFPFPDALQVGIDAGVTAVIAPGGSVRDEEAIAAADAANVAMIFTGVRHFRH